MNIETYGEAKKIFLHYNGSYFHMQRERYLEQYMKFNISKKEERKWLKEKVEKILSKMSEIKNINLKYDKYWNILYILTKTLEDNHLLDKTISAFEKDLKYLDIFSINMILEMIHANKKIWKNYKRKLKTVIQQNDISINEIISKEHNKSNGTQFFTEEEVMKGYRKILSELNQKQKRSYIRFRQKDERYEIHEKGQHLYK